MIFLEIFSLKSSISSVSSSYMRLFSNNVVFLYIDLSLTLFFLYFFVLFVADLL